MRLGGMLLSCAIVAGCSDAATPAPTSPSPPPLPVDTVSVQGRWEGTYLYDRVEPSGCLVVGLTGAMCPTSPVPMVLTIAQDGTQLIGQLTTSIYGDAGPAAGPFPLTGRLETPSMLTLTGQQPGGDISCAHVAVRRMVSFTLRRSTAKSVEGEFHFDGDRRLNSCFFFKPQVFAKDVRLRHVSP